MKCLKFWLSIVIMLTAILAFTRPWGTIPPLGKLLSPSHGIWQNTQDALDKENIQLPGLSQPVTVIWDHRRVPHIFAQSKQDAYMAQGYVTARDRLWQMDFLTRATAGELSEIIGTKTLEYDRLQRGLGMTYAAEQALAEISRDPETLQILQAYSDGVNAYIATLKPHQYPIEYKILDYAPKPWTPLRTCLILKTIAWMLTGSAQDLYLSRSLQRFGPQATEELYPSETNDSQPVIPRKDWDFSGPKLDIPDSLYIAKYLGSPMQGMATLGNGSNNWAASGTKTASGYPLLANDPHLEFSAPMIWYETQITTPEHNVYGVAIPGAPAIVIGFNNKIAWGVTNGYMDVVDWYEIEFKDDSWSHYQYNNEWRPTQRRDETILIRGKSPEIAHVYYTHYGPIVVPPPHDRPTKYPIQAAMRWTGHDPSNDMRALLGINYAQNYDEFVQAVCQFNCPSQNFVFASQDGDIAMWHNGKLPIKWKGQGKTVCPGNDPRYEWHGWIPPAQLPHVHNPTCGFVRSANQMAADPSYPYFITGSFERFRNQRIHEVLSQNILFKPEDFQRLQMDTKNLIAVAAVPQFLAWIDPSTLSSDQAAVYHCLKEWDCHNDPDAIAPTIFSMWWRNLERAIWEDELGKDRTYFMYPFWYRTLDLVLQEPQSPWMDNINTPEKETAMDLVRMSFDKTCQFLIHKYGKLGTNWNWAKHKGTQIPHLARIPGLGKEYVACGGGRHIVQACSKEFGASWRMVVSLEPQIKAWGIYPGGQSGNPGSPYYDNLLQDWQQGKLQPLQFLTTPSIPESQILCTWVMK